MEEQRTIVRIKISKRGCVISDERYIQFPVLEAGCKIDREETEDGCLIETYYLGE